MADGEGMGGLEAKVAKAALRPATAPREAAVMGASAATAATAVTAATGAMEGACFSSINPVRRTSRSGPPQVREARAAPAARMARAAWQARARLRAPAASRALPERPAVPVLLVRFSSMAKHWARRGYRDPGA